MKRFKLLWLLVAVIFCACEAPRQNPEQAYVNDLEIIVLDSCEYILFDSPRGTAGIGGICHKQNCKFCAERNRKQTCIKK